MKDRLSTLLSISCLLAATGLHAGELSVPPGDTDAVPVLQAALAKCREEKLSRLVLAPGTWHLHPEQAAGMFRHVSNHDPGYKRVAIHLDGLDGFELDGGGATLLCHGVLNPLAIDNSKNITIRNLTIEWDKPFHLEGTVTTVGDDYFDVEMLPECEVLLKDGRIYGGVAEGIYGAVSDPAQARQDIRWNYWINPATRAAAKTQGHLSLWSRRTNDFAEMTELGPNKFRLRNAHGKALPDNGSVMVCKGTNRRNRLSAAIHATSTDGLLLEDITIHHAGGMGLIAEDCSDPTVKNLRVALKEDTTSLVTTTADATHFVACRGTVHLEDCLFENMLDDSCNVHGVYAIAEGLVAPDRLGISFSHFQQLGTAFARPGDKLRLIDRETLLPYGDTRSIQSLERVNQDYYILSLDRPIDGFYRDNSSVENLTTRPGLVYRNNTVRNNRARGILVTAGGKVIIEGNRFERMSMSAVLIEGDNHWWYESGAVVDVTIRNNTFIGHSTTDSLFKLAPMQPQAPPIQPPYHHNIRITGNTIEAACPVVVEARRISGLVFADNKVTFQGEATGSSDPAFRLTACEKTSISGNTFSRESLIETNPADTRVALDGNEKLSRAPRK